jgi:SEC-C motif domain protein
MAKPARPAGCPCGRQLPYAACCGRFVDGAALAPDAETLMRSRYTAYTLSREDYLRATWHASTCPPDLDLAAEPQPRWLGLEVKHHAEPDAGHATVEFVARYKVGGRAHRLHEVSRFVWEDGRWWYVDGDIRP